MRDFQNAFVRIATDEAFRNEFFEETSESLKGFALTEKEIRVLGKLDRIKVDRYARSLHQKRWRELAGVIPLTRRICPTIRERYWRWLAHNPPQVSENILHPGTAEALRALPALCQSLLSDGSEAPYCTDMLAFEVLRDSSNQDGNVRHLQCRYPIHEIAEEIGGGLIPIDVDMRAVSYRFGRFGVRWRYGG